MVLIIRKTAEELKKLMDEEGVDTIWSWSRINSWHVSKYVYFLHYIKHVPETLSNIYSELGGAVHETLEKYYHQEISYKDMGTYFNSLWLAMYELGASRFDRNDEEKDKKIAEKYKKDMIDFFHHHKPLTGNVILEYFLKIKPRDDIVLQGYADVIFRDPIDDKYVIGDWKTSTIYKNEKKDNELGQLVIYALGLHQMFGIPFEKIKVGWNFLKYTHVSYTQANGKSKTREIERSKLVQSMKVPVKMMLKRHGYEVNDYVDRMVIENDLSCLPEDVLDEFLFEDCWVMTDVTDSLIEKWVSHLCQTIDDIQERTRKYKETCDEQLFFDSDEEYEKKDYFMSRLCGYPIDLIKPYKNYLERIERQKSREFLNMSSACFEQGKMSDKEWLDGLLK